ncbi:MAG: sigma-70 family RNA polymerase sigma factor [Bacteroidia bacterium]|nr:sigma-70 family RNA polymerase sigma factor [Bacteroidia bacterium]
MTRNAFNDIIHKLNRKLFVIAYSIIKNRQESEDVVQEVFMKMWMMKDKLDYYENINALAVTMTRNSCIDLLRKWKYIDSEKDGSDTQAADQSPTPYDQMVSLETREIVSGIIDDLPEACRDLVQLREINGMSYEEIASQNGMNINNLRVILSRARQMIKEKYIKYTDERGKTERITGKVL